MNLSYTQRSISIQTMVDRNSARVKYLCNPVNNRVLKLNQGYDILSFDIEPDISWAFNTTRSEMKISIK